MPIWSVNKVTGGTATGNDEAGSPAGEKPPKGADGDVNTKWLEFKAGGTPFWWQYDFGAGVAWKIAGYKLCTGNDAVERDPKTWTLQGSNTGAYGGEEVTVDTIADGSLPAARNTWTSIYTCDSPPATAYRYYRIVISDLKDLAAAVGVQVSEFEMYEDETVMGQDMILTGNITW